MSVETKNQSVKLNKVVLDNVDAAVVVVTKVDGRTNNPGRPVNKQSARYKRLAKQKFYNRVNSKFVSGKSFQLDKGSNQSYSYRPSKGERYGCIVSPIGGHVCNVSYIGRTKVQGYAFVMNKRVNVELNLKTIKFVK